MIRLKLVVSLSLRWLHETQLKDLYQALKAFLVTSLGILDCHRVVPFQRFRFPVASHPTRNGSILLTCK